MKKPLILLLILTLLAALSTGAFLYVKHKDDQKTAQETEKQADNVLFSLDPESINTITIENSEGKYTAEYDSDNGWVLTECPGERFPVNQTALQAVTTTFSYLKASNSYGEITDEKKKTYGLDGDIYKLTLVDTEPHIIYIGAESPTKDYYYAMVEGKKNIYAITAGDTETMKLSENGIRATDLLFTKDKDITGVKLEKNGKAEFDLVFDESASTWKLTGKLSELTVDQTAVSAMIKYMTKLEAASLLENHLEDLSKYGLDDPESVLTITAKDGTKEVIKFSAAGSNNDLTPVLLTNTNQAANFFTSDIYFTEYTALDFLPSVIEGANLFSINAFEFDAMGYKDSFKVDFTNKTGECRGTSLALDNAVLSSLFETFYNTFTYLQITDIDIDASPDIKDAVITADYHYADKEDRSIALVEAGNNQAYIFLNGKYTGLLTELKMLSGANSVASTYKAMCDQAGLDPQKSDSPAVISDEDTTEEAAQKETEETTDEESEDATEVTNTPLTVQDNPLAQ
ncbi:MAG: DUF4340 domain-containing protein [Ruminococcus sp.]|nr:DUF4340 domain-containing protein [Ruminococcus sp.]